MVRLASGVFNRGQDSPSSNPNGIPSFSPRVAESARLPWVNRLPIFIYPERVESTRPCFISAATPLGLRIICSADRG